MALIPDQKRITDISPIAVMKAMKNPTEITGDDSFLISFLDVFYVEKICLPSNVFVFKFRFN